MQVATLVPSLWKINPHSVWQRQAVDLESPDPSAFDIHEICLGTAVDDAAIYPASMASCWPLRTVAQPTALTDGEYDQPGRPFAALTQAVKC